MRSENDGTGESDGFALYMTIIAALFGLGGLALAELGAVVLLAGVPVLVAVFALLVRRLSQWDVVRALRPARHETFAGGRVTRFSVASQNDARQLVTQGSWGAPTSDPAMLPAAVKKPKVAVETNTEVG